jgi:hypothetical protein
MLGYLLRGIPVWYFVGSSDEHYLLRCLSRYLFSNSTLTPSHFCLCCYYCCYYYCCYYYRTSATRQTPPSPPKRRARPTSPKPKSRRIRAAPIVSKAAVLLRRRTLPIPTSLLAKGMCDMDLFGSFGSGRRCVSVRVHISLQTHALFQTTPINPLHNHGNVFGLLLSPVKPPRPKAK